MNKLIFDIIAIVGGILLIIGLNSPPGIVGQGCFIIGGVIFGMGIIKRCTKFLDPPENIKLSNKPDCVSTARVALCTAMFITLGLIEGALAYILLNPKEHISIAIVNTVFPIPVSMASQLPQGFITTILLILFVGIGGPSILFPLVLIAMPECRNTRFEIIGEGEKSV